MRKTSLPGMNAHFLLVAKSGNNYEPHRGSSPTGAAVVPSMTAREGACAAAAGMAGIGVAGAGGGAGGITVAVYAYKYCMGQGPGWMYA